MTREEIEKKAKELGIKYQTPCHGVGDCEFEARQAATEMGEWLLSHLWVSVDDELPKVGEKVLIKHQYGSQVAARFRYNEIITSETYWGVNEEMPIGADITHWMPIPPLAEEGGENGR